MIYRVDNYFESEINPFTSQPYDDTWIVYRLTDSNEYQTMVGNSNSSVYTVKVSKNNPDWMMSVCDFIQFQESRNKNIILDITQEDLQKAQTCYQGHSYNDHFLRETEPDILIHSTTYENWVSIEQDRCLKSWNILNAEKAIWESSPIGQELGDPLDFRNFIMFSSGSVSGEIVVLSKQNRKIVMNQDMQYITGARLYFDGRKIAADGLLIRDGIHLKVLNQLPLDPYLLWCATWNKIELDSNISTPKEFAERSNTTFYRLFHHKIKTTY